MGMSFVFKITRYYRRDLTGLFYFRSKNKSMVRRKKRKYFRRLRRMMRRLEKRYGFLYSLVGRPRFFKRKKRSFFFLRLKIKRCIMAYYGLREKGLKHVFEKVKQERKGKLSVNGFLNNFIYKLEMTLKMLVLRMGFVVSLVEANYKIRIGYFMVNGEIERQSARILKVGDFISVSPHYYRAVNRRLKRGIRKRKIFSFTSRYFFMNYNILCGFLLKQPEYIEIPYVRKMRFVRLISLFNSKRW